MNKKILCDLGIDEYKIYQEKSLFQVGTDSVLLSDFIKVKKGETVIDLGTGTGIIPILLAIKTKGLMFYGIDIVDEAYYLAYENVKLNGLEDKIKIEKVNIKDVYNHYKFRFNVVVTNPPYMLQSENSKNEKMKCVNDLENLKIARHEVLCTIEDVVYAGSRLLGTKGRFYIVYRPERLATLFYFMKKYNIEPKKMVLVQPFKDKDANIVLVEGIKDGKEGLKVEPSIIINNKK